MFVYELFDSKEYKCTCLPGDKDPDCPKHGLEPMDVGDALDIKKETKQRLDPSCWKGYRKAGTKMKGGVRVNNCVPANEAREHDEGNKEPPNNFAIYINNKKWKVFPGMGYYADDYREQAQYKKLQDWCKKKTAATGKQWNVYVTGEPVSESISEENKGLYYNVNKRKKAGTSRDKDHPKAPTAQAWKDAAKTAKKEDVAEGINDTIYPNAEVIKSRNGKPVGEIYQDGNSWGCFHYKADSGYDMLDSREDAIQELKNLHNENMGKGPDYTIKGVAEGVQDSLELQDAAKVLKQYGATNLKTTSNELHFYKDGRSFSVNLIWKDDATRGVNLHELNHVVRTLKAQDNKFNFNPDDNWSQDFETRMSKGVAEGGAFSYGAKKPKKGSVADLAAKKREEQEKGQQPAEPKDHRVGVAKVVKEFAPKNTR